MHLCTKSYVHVSWASCKLPGFDQGGRKTESESSEHLSGRPVLLPSLSSCTPQTRQLVGGSEKLTSCLPPGAGKESDGIEKNGR